MVFSRERVEIINGSNLIEFGFHESLPESLMSYTVPHFEEAGEISRKGLMPLVCDKEYSQLHPSCREQIFINPFLPSEQIGLVGFDFRVGNLIAESDVVKDHVTEKDLLEMSHKKLGKGEEYIIHPDRNGEKVYYIVGLEQISLSPDLEMIVDSKSTTGRLGGMTHFVGKTKDQRPITAFQSFSFPLKVKSGVSKLSQAVIRYSNSFYLSPEQILKANLVRMDGKKIEKMFTSNGLHMKFETKAVYQALKSNGNMEPIDLEARNLNWKNYFELIEGKTKIDAEKKTLYLLGSQGTIELDAVCGILSRSEGVLTGTGAWGHLAGIFQPFYKGSITMEFYSHEKREIREGSGAGYVKFEAIDGNVEDPKIGSYLDQIAPRLPKMFAQD